MFKPIQQLAFILIVIFTFSFSQTAPAQTISPTNWRKMNELPHLVLRGELKEAFLQVTEHTAELTSREQQLKAESGSRDQAFELLKDITAKVASMKKDFRQQILNKELISYADQTTVNRTDLGIVVPGSLNQAYQKAALQAGMNWVLTDLAPDLGVQSNTSIQPASLGLMMGITVLHSHLSATKPMHNVILVANFSNSEMNLTDSYIVEGKMTHYPAGKRIPAATSNGVSVGIFVFEKEFGSNGLHAALRLCSANQPQQQLKLGFGMDNHFSTLSLGKNTCAISTTVDLTLPDFLKNEVHAKGSSTVNLWQQSPPTPQHLKVSMRIVSVERISAQHKLRQPPYKATYPRMLVAIKDSQNNQLVVPSWTHPFSQRSLPLLSSRN